MTIGPSNRRASTLLGAGAVALLFLHSGCVADMGGEYSEDSSEKEDGQSRGVVGLTPGESFSIQAQCDEWFSCDLDVTVALDSIGRNAIFAEAEARADRDEVDGNFMYELPLFSVSITEVRFNTSFDIDVSAEVAGVRVAGDTLATDYSFIAGGRRIDGEELSFFAESEDEEATYDIRLTSLQDFNRVVQVRVAASWF